MIPVTLYKRDARGNILRWQINQLADGTISIAHGIYAHKPHVEFINPTMKKANEVQSRINAKRKEGYKAIEDLWDNAPKELDSANTYEYLRLYLPKYNTTSEGFVLPMLAKTLEDNKPFEKFGTMLGQYKINGLRCIIGAEKVVGDLFNSLYRLNSLSFKLSDKAIRHLSIDLQKQTLGVLFSSKSCSVNLLFGILGCNTSPSRLFSDT